MILHYANLTASAGGVDAFLIGSELRSLMRVRSRAGIYPAVDALVTLAADVTSVVGSSTIVTYGAEWTEYGADVVDPGASEVRFPLDPLWACSAIDAVGIDYYAPLADWRDEAGHLDASVAASTYDLGYLAENVYGGEGFDWYYTDDWRAPRRIARRLPTDWQAVDIPHAQETELPREARFGFTDGTVDYRRSAVTSRRLAGGSNRSVHSDLAVVSDDASPCRCRPRPTGPGVPCRGRYTG